ncbi:MAG: discoidin domain-containing protein [Planctomycetota bacterium]
MRASTAWIAGLAAALLAIQVSSAQAAEQPAEAAAMDSLEHQLEAEWLAQDCAQTHQKMGTQSDAAGGVDGIKTGGFAFHTNNEDKPWWQVDLGTSQELARAVVFNRCSPDWARARTLTVLLSDEGKEWREAYQHDGSFFGGVTDNKPLTVDLKGAKARFLRIQLRERNWLHLDEIEVYPTADPKKNIALHCPADQSSVSEWSVAHAVPQAVPTELPVQAAIDRGRRVAAEMQAAGREVQPTLDELDRVEKIFKAKALEPTAKEQLRELYRQAHQAIRKLVFSDPLLAFDKLLFVKRVTFRSSHIYTDYFDGSHDFGGNLCVLSPVAPDGKVTELVPELNGGIFGRCDLSCDAQKVVFSYKKRGSGYRIYEVAMDGTGLRQLTQDGADEPDMLKQFGHGYDDMDPCYLPNGKIMFASTRSKRAVLCHNSFTSTALHVMDSDGGNLHFVSGNTVNEFTPTVMNDGRVLYTRWEYVDKGSGDVQSLWCMHPDGTHACHVYKNNVRLPSTLIDGRQIPGEHRFIAVGAPHMPLAVGPVVLIDTHISQLTPDAMTNLTPEIKYPGHGGYPTTDKGYYKEPWPLSDRLFLVAYNSQPSHSAPAGYGLYVLTASNHRELLYRDPKISCWQPIPLRSRPCPPNLSPAAEIPALAEQKQAALVLTDVYQGLTGIERGRVKYIRVMEDVPKPWASSFCAPANGDVLGLQNPAVAMNGHLAIKKMHGIVPVNEDGSVSFIVPSGKNLYFQALDANYMELQRMRTFVNLMPGESRSCIGCHEPRTHAPPSKRTLASLQQPQPLQFQPGDSGPRMIHYPSDVQPILDKHCINCHGSDKPKGDLDLSGELTTLFCRSYENLVSRKLINHIDVDPRDAYIPAEPPLTFGSHRSKMVLRLLKGDDDVKLSQEEFVRLVTWIDANAPYYGIYEGRRNIKWKDQPGFRPVPVAAK